MKKIATFLILLLTFAGAHAKGSIRWLEKEHDFGAFDETDELVSTRFQFINETDGPVAITSVRVTCGCTTPTYSTDPVAPGDTATITVSYDSDGRPGRFSKKIYVNTTASDTRTDLIIKGVVIGNENSVKGRFPMEAGKLRLRTGAVMLGKIAKGKAKMEWLNGYNRSHDTITPSVIYHPEYVEITSVPQRVAPGEQMQFNIYFRSDRCQGWGAVTDSITILSDPGESPVTLPMVAIVEEDFSRLTPGELQNAPIARVDTRRVDLGVIPASATEPQVATLTLANAGKSTLKIRRLDSEDPAVAVSVKEREVKKGKSTKITVRVLPDSAEVINKVITLITNDPVNPVQTIRVVGMKN